MRSDDRRWCAVWTASLLASGCAFTVDADVVKGGGAGSTPPVDSGPGDDEDAAESPEPDASTDADTDSGAVQPPETDAEIEPVPPGCEGAGCPAACNEDAECEAHEYCSKTLSTCQPGCDDWLGCVGPRAAAVTGMLSAEGLVYWSTTNTGDDFAGNALDDGAVWSWDLQDDPVELAVDLYSAELLFEADEQLYFLRMRTTTRRSYRDLCRVQPAAGGAIEVISENVDAAWNTPDSIFWSTTKLEGDAPVELWRMERAASASRALVATATHEGWLGGDDERVFHGEKLDDGREFLVADQLPDLNAHEQLIDGNYWTSTTLIVDGSFLYFAEPRSQEELLWLDLEADSLKRLAPPSVGRLFYFAQGGWIYWAIYTQGSNMPLEVVYGRTSQDLSEGGQLLRRRASDRWQPPVFAIVGQRMVYWNADEERLFILNLTAAGGST